MADRNRRWVLKRRPQGLPGREDFELREEAVPAPKDGEMVVRNLYLSCDPTQRFWMERDTYVPAVAIGEVMRSISAGRVVASKHPRFREGDVVSGAFGWQDYAVTDGRGLMPVVHLPEGVAVPTALSLFGITGLSAWVGIAHLAKVKPGDSVLVSGAAGSTGSIAAQLAKARGARVVGIAGGPKKCGWLTGEIGLDAAIDYRSEKVSERVAAHFPKGVDVFFDNVGGEMLDAAMANLAKHARVIICGFISGYTEAQGPPRASYIGLILHSASMQGFLVFDYAAHFPEAFAELGRYASEKKLVDQIDVSEGLESAPDALRRLFTGENLGKQLVRVAD